MLWGVCLALAASPDTDVRFMAVERFTLAWTHSIEKVRWEEDYSVVADPVAGDSVVPCSVVPCSAVTCSMTPDSVVAPSAQQPDTNKNSPDSQGSDCRGTYRLQADQARIKGSAAGMEPPADARLENGWYTYQPPQPLEPVLQLSRSRYTADYEWCVDGTCTPMESILPSDGGITLLYVCPKPSS